MSPALPPRREGTLAEKSWAALSISAAVKPVEVRRVVAQCDAIVSLSPC
ncbi:hypothetical protein I545_0196 [Mycobacterium kansasii 662]|uniref:Uncharacterized protein n=1 Tax=Mycobacterium kansasii 662 TaxID=1299326 RepID=X7ZSP3_MYCKA|nr:hypothetical protein I547_1227 [Mycobacterium kansasii 824]EUA22061.1 hypothetical protein I545_0196 [Mycobacterium kansasii 662]KEP43783.1 hypothetical protein MKSMC1_11470 [Mycobacterium kansasii]